MKIYKNKEGRNHLKMRNKETLDLVTNAAKSKIGLLVKESTSCLHFWLECLLG